MQTLEPTPVSESATHDRANASPPNTSTEVDGARPSAALGRVPAYDGLRGTAMVLVLLSHVWVVMPPRFLEGLGPVRGLFNSGSLGVVLFLVLGGFLVTNGLLATTESTGSVQMARFWGRRLLRIAAPLYAMLAVYLLVGWSEGFSGSTPETTLRTAWRAATFSLNWAYIQDAGGLRADLGHLWYLSVEQQFYVVWVVVLAVLARHRRLLGAVLAGSTVAVMAWRAVVYEQAGWWDASLRTDTRIDGLLLGALAAIIWRGVPELRGSRFLAPAGAVLMAVLVAANFQSRTSYLGLLGAAFAIAAAAAVLGLANDGGPTVRVLRVGPLRSLGAISYPVYLWHLPIFYAVARWGREWPWPVRLAAAIAVLAVAVVGSRRFVERPIGLWLARRDGTAPPAPARSDAARFTGASLAGAVVASVPFVMVLWNFGIRPLRTALPARIFSDFYDVQARALMHGHLDVPKGVLAIEAFQVGGRDYMYFPPLPALLRIPVLAATDSLDGRLTALSMLSAWLLIVTFTALLLWRVRGLVRPGVALARGEAVAGGVLLAVVAGGSVLLFIAALPWVYHEAYMWSTAMAIGSLFATIGVLERPSGGRIILAAGLALGAALSRTTVGWACCLTLIAAGGALAIQPQYRHYRRYVVATLIAGFVPLAVGAAINWAKFHHPFMFPLDKQVWTDLNEHRRQALAANGGDLTGMQFFPSSFVNYFRPNGIRFTPLFPYITLPAQPARAVNDAFIDQTYRTGSVPAFMPLLFLLALWGLATSFRRRATDGLARLRIPVLGALAITGGVMFYGYIAHRYTAEFLPALVLLSAIGLTDAVARAATWRAAARRAALTGLIVLAAFGVLANTAVGVTTARVAEGGQSLRNMLGLSMQLSDWSGHPLDRSVERAASLDRRTSADRIRIVGDCDAVYLATGDQYEPWTPVDVRGLAAEIFITGGGGPGRIPIVAFEGNVERSLELDHDGRGNYRLIVEGATQDYQPGDWYALEPGTVLTVDVSAVGEYSQFIIDAPAFVYAAVPMMDWDRDWVGVPNQLHVIVPPERLQRARGAEVVVRWHPPSPFCRRLAASTD